MFIGEYSHNLDAKGRIVIPTRFRDELENNFILTRGLDGCLAIYSNKQWEKTLADLQKLPNTKKVTRQYLHVLTSRACECEVDKNGRIQIPSFLSQPVNITKECAIVGAYDHVEIWDKETWEHYYAEASDSFEEVAESLSDLMGNE